MATILATFCLKLNKPDYVPVAIVTGFTLDFVIMYNYLSM
jgi:hypothetical protein